MSEIYLQLWLEISLNDLSNGAEYSEFIVRMSELCIYEVGLFKRNVQSGF